jgi:hypothetical protein
MNSSKNSFNYKKISDYRRYLTTAQQKISTINNSIPLSIKILNVIISFILMYYFTIFRYNLFLSVILGIITFLMINFLSKGLAIIFIILYIIVIVNKSNKSKRILGTPILQTDIIRNKGPFNCTNNSLTIQNNLLPNDLNSGFFTYSYWLYINGNNNDINKNNNWYSYRYDEWKSILYRGSSLNNLINSEENGNNLDLSGIVQYPGFWLTPKLNNMVIVFQNEGNNERIEINNLEFNKWINIVTVIELKSVSIYINGRLERTLNLIQNSMNMNQYNLYIANDKMISKNENESGFAGSIAQLTYYNYVLKNSEIMESYKYYKKIIDNYQNKFIKNNYNFKNSILIRNDDILS